MLKGPKSAVFAWPYWNFLKTYFKLAIFADSQQVLSTIQFEIQPNEILNSSTIGICTLGQMCKKDVSSTGLHLKGTLKLETKYFFMKFNFLMNKIRHFFGFSVIQKRVKYSLEF